MKNYYLIINLCNIIDNLYQVEQATHFFPCVRRTWVPALEFILFLKSDGKWVIFQIECRLLFKYLDLKKKIPDRIYFWFRIQTNHQYF
jgi:hypothetical protein